MKIVHELNKPSTSSQSKQQWATNNNTTTKTLPICLISIKCPWKLIENCLKIKWNKNRNKKKEIDVENRSFFGFGMSVWNSLLDFLELYWLIDGITKYPKRVRENSTQL